MARQVATGQTPNLQQGLITKKACTAVPCPMHKSDDFDNPIGLYSALKGIKVRCKTSAAISGNVHRTLIEM